MSESEELTAAIESVNADLLSGVIMHVKSVMNQIQGLLKYLQNIL